MIWPAPGAYWDRSSVVWGMPAGSGEVANCESPLGGNLQSIRELSAEELAVAFSPKSGAVSAPPVHNLDTILREYRQVLTGELRLSMGFTAKDSEEVLDGCISFASRFKAPHALDSQGFQHAGRRIGLRRVPWGTIAAILPQNAAFYMGLIVVVNGLASGNRVILRSPSGSYRLMAIFAEVLAKAGFNEESFCIVACPARDFTHAWEHADHPILLHFMGSSQRAGDLMKQSFEAGKPCLIDGEGNGWIYVDEDQDPREAAEMVWRGATRYNGQTCTSINGAYVHPAIDSDFRLELRHRIARTTFGTQDTDQVGPLFGTRQVEEIESAVGMSGGRVGRSGLSHRNVCSPMFIEDPVVDSDLVRKGIFGPALWLRTGNWHEFQREWRLNQYPLSVAVLSHDPSVQDEAVRLPGASRVVLNGDPSLEDPLEPWGAYPRCGINPVSGWIDKYYRVLQVDEAV